jgi:hypothetical protein
LWGIRPTFGYFIHGYSRLLFYSLQFIKIAQAIHYHLASEIAQSSLIFASRFPKQLLEIRRHHHT